jgi:ankyrin repeat protein
MHIILRDIDTAPPLWIAAYNGKLHRVHALLEDGADPVEQASSQKCTALHAAALMGHDAIVQLFIDAGVYVDVTDKDGLTPLQYAVTRLMTDVVHRLIHFGAKLSAPLTYPQKSMVLIAIDSLAQAKHSKKPGEMYAHGHRDIDGAMLVMVRILLAGGAQLSPPGSRHCYVWERAIHANGSERDIELFRVLIRYRLNELPTYTRGNTIMHEVASLGVAECPKGEDIQMLKLLVRCGLDPFVQNDRREQPVDMAERANKADTVRYLLQGRESEREIAREDDIRGPIPYME